MSFYYLVGNIDHIIVLSLFLPGVSQGKKPGQESRQGDQKEEKKEAADQRKNKERNKKPKSVPCANANLTTTATRKKPPARSARAPTMIKKAAALCGQPPS